MPPLGRVMDWGSSIRGIPIARSAIARSSSRLSNAARSADNDCVKAKNHPTGSSRPAKLPLRKRLLFSGIALLLPLALLALIEFGLRLAGFGGYPPTFKQLATYDNGDRLIASNAESSQAYFFRNRDLPGTLTEAAFRLPKPADTIRVFMVGGSAIKGYPQLAAFAPSAFLEEMLGDAWPEKQVEVINLGTTAVASYPVLEMLRDALKHEPDLIIVYSGHNEFFGAYGVASLNTIARTPGLIALQHNLRRLGLLQWIDGLFAGRTPDRPAGAMLMEIMMARPFIGPNDPLRGAAARNLQAHIERMIDHCRSAGVPIIVCTLPSNERGLAPLGTSSDDHLSDEHAAAVLRVMEGTESLIGEDPRTAIEELREAVTLAPDHARLHWLLATALHADGRYEDAQKHFISALDLDPMPWRATSSQNDAIRQAAASRNAWLCDVQGVFRRESEGASIGWDLMDDHVHMSLRGQALVAEAIVEKLGEVDGTLRIAPEMLSERPSWASYAERLGNNIFEQYAVAYRMRRLFDVPFFSETNPHAAAIMDARLSDLRARMSESEQRATTAWHDPAIHQNFTRPLSSVIGPLALAEGRLNDAAPLFYTVYRIMPAYSNQSIEFAYRYTRTVQRLMPELPAEAERIARDAIDRALLMIANSSEREFTLQRHVGALFKVLGDHSASIPYLVAARPGFGEQGLVELDQTLIHSFLETGDIQNALQLARTGMAHAGRFAPAYEQMHAQILSGTQDRKPNQEIP